MLQDRLRQKSDLQFMLGRLFGPVLGLIEHPERYDKQEEAETLARYFAEIGPLQEEFRRFCSGQAGHNYAIEFHNFYNALDGVRSRLIGKTGTLEVIVRESLATAQGAIDAIPVPRMSVILEAGSPFTAYRRLRELCEADAIQGLSWLDPYIGASIFHRYLSGIRPNVPIILVVSEPGAHAGKSNQARWTEFLDVSRLYCAGAGDSAVSPCRPAKPS